MNKKLVDVESYLVDLQLSGRRPATVMNLRRVLTKFFVFCGRESALEVTVDDIRKFLLHYQSRLSINSFFIYTARLKQFFRVANPPIYDYLKTLKSTKQKTYLTIKALTRKQILSLATQISKRHKGYETLLLYLADTGARIGETCNLDLNDLHITQDGYYHIVYRSEITKTKQQRDVYLYRSSVAGCALTSYLRIRKPKNSDALFLNGWGQRISTNRFEVKMALAAKELGIQKKCTPHVLRHTYVTTMRDKGVDPNVVRANTGHSLTTMLEIYDHISAERKKEIALKHQIV